MRGAGCCTEGTGGCAEGVRGCALYAGDSEWYVMRCELLCMPEVVEGELCSLEGLE